MLIIIVSYIKIEIQTDVRSVGRDMVLTSGVKVLFRPFHRWFYSLVLSPQFPPLGIVVRVSDGSTEHLPSPLIDHVPERQKSDFKQFHLH